MNASIIIPTKNRTKLLEETISAIFDKQEFRLGKFEVLVVNDGNEEPTAIQQKYKEVKVIRNKGAGAAWARNTGAEYAQYELLLFIDDDMLIAPHCISRHVELHQKFNRALISGSWEYSPALVNTLKASSFGRYKLEYDYKSLKGEEKNLLSPGIYKTNVLASFNLSILKKDFDEIGGYNTNFPYAGCEDQELTMRAMAKNFQLILDTANISLHNEKDRANMNSWLMRQYTGVQGYPLLCDLFPTKKLEPLYMENGLIRDGDSNDIQRKKKRKHFLSSRFNLSLIKLLTSLLELFRVNDKVLFRLYKGLGGLYIYKGFYQAEIQLKKTR